MPFDRKTASEAGRRSSRKGVPNRSTTTLRQYVQALLDDNYEQIAQDLKKLKPKERVDAWCRLLEYALPKLQRSEMSIDISKLSDDQVDQMLDRAIQNLEGDG